MTDWLRGIPLVRAVSELRKRFELGAAALYAAIALVAVLIVALPMSTGLQNLFARAHHMRAGNSWLLIQIVPKMYSFSNQVWRIPEPKPDDDRLRMAPVWVNHYPSRMLRVDGRRAELSRDNVVLKVFLRSTYRGNIYDSAYVVRESGGKITITERPVDR